MKVRFNADGREYVVKAPWILLPRDEKLKRIFRRYPRLLDLFYLYAVIDDDDLPKRNAVLRLAEQIGRRRL